MSHEVYCGARNLQNGAMELVRKGKQAVRCRALYKLKVPLAWDRHAVARRFYACCVISSWGTV